MSADAAERPKDFIRQIVDADLRAGKHPFPVTRFPPEPNGRLHIGHIRPICTNFEIAAESGGRCHLRFDDTNPAAEETEFVDAIERDIRWLGYDWGEHRYFASDYFGRLYECAEELIRRGHAFVCDLSSEEIAARRGTLTEPGEESPYRDRSVEENLDLFARMKAGEFDPGKRVLRGKIDMGSSVLPMRDPILYRIVAAEHHRTGDAWHVYPMYDFAHSLSDAFEGITHSLCSLEFVDRRPLYNWILESLGYDPHPVQIEFARLTITYTVTSKRWLRRLVEGGFVSGWDDPRMPTLAGIRRRGVPPAALRAFNDDLALTRVGDAVVEIAKLDHCIRDELNRVAQRRMGVLRPLKIVIENYPEGQVEELECVNNPEDPQAGTRRVPFSREIWIERDDFLENPPKNFFRLGPGREVRLRYAYLITCTDVVKDEAGEVVELRCSYDPATRGGDAPDGRKVKGTLHWVSAPHALEAEARLYATLFDREDPLDVPAGADVTASLNPDSVEVIERCFVEPSVAELPVGEAFQFERLGYFCPDSDGDAKRPVLNRTITLRDTWSKVQKKSGAAAT